MPPTELDQRGAHVMIVCNSCRYCEQYCPVFPAMERRLTFEPGDLAYLANLCHNCGECLYACQYAPPHEFGIDVPRTLAELRLQSYEECSWPGPLARAFRRQGVGIALALWAGFSAVLGGATLTLNPEAFGPASAGADFYAVMPHGAMVTLFGAVGGFVLLALGIGMARFRRLTGSSGGRVDLGVLLRALREGVTLKHLHGSGRDCTSAEETRRPWRRWWHHATLGGFALTFASTSVAALYHSVFGWAAPYGYSSLPVLLGTIGGLGLIAGPLGQWWESRQRDPALADPQQHGMDAALLLLLWLTSATGLLLLVLRETAAMAPLLLLHLALVLALFVTMPYGKFVHGFYRLLALAKNSAEAGR